MAEKEERISVIVYEKDPCENCSGNPMTDCQVCEKDLRYDGGITRQEAIDRIAKSLCQSEGWPCKECRYGKDNVSCQTCLEVELYKQYAEAALNAL